MLLRALNGTNSRFRAFPYLTTGLTDLARPIRQLMRFCMGFDRKIKQHGNSTGTDADQPDEQDRVTVLMMAERLFTVEEYARLCADISNGKVEIRRFDDGFVLVRDY